MLIDAFQDHFLDALDANAVHTSASNNLFLLIDGAFVPGIHKTLATESKSLLFASLPACSDETADASPFLTPYIPGDKRIRSILRRCTGWPMLSLIETRESLAQLAARLSAWCIVEADGQRFNFQFPDTRRLPAIFRVFSPDQRERFTGPLVRWSYVNREGGLSELITTGSNLEPAVNPTLDGQQFAALVEDSRADEVLVLLGDRGHAVGTLPSLSHARISAALCIAVSQQLTDEDALDWCEWYWRYSQASDNPHAVTAFEAWRNTSFLEQ